MINDLINTLTQSTEFHLLAAFLLGILLAINPCQIAISLSAISAIANKQTDPKMILKKSIIFAMGRMTLYLILGTASYFLARFIGLNMKNIYSEKITAAIELFVPFVIAVLGVFFLIRAIHRHHHNDTCHNSGKMIKKNKNAGVVMLGFILALLFCPESAVFFFGIMIPLTTMSDLGLLLLPVFSITAVLPVIIIAYLCKLSLEKTNMWENRLEKIQYKINLISSIILLFTAVILFLM